MRCRWYRYNFYTRTFTISQRDVTPSVKPADDLLYNLNNDFKLMMPIGIKRIRIISTVSKPDIKMRKSHISRLPDHLALP